MILKLKLMLLRWLLNDDKVLILDALYFSQSYMEYIRDERGLKGLHQEAVGTPNAYDTVTKAIEQLTGTPLANNQPDTNE